MGTHKGILAGAAALSIVACGDRTRSDHHASASTRPAPTVPIDAGDAGGMPPEALNGKGWTLQDDTPYPRIGHSAVLDEQSDRMIVFGGGANDTWALPLSGPNALRWQQIVALGQLPPVHTYAGNISDSAVYDRAAHRMIVIANGAFDISQLSLDGAPTWKPFPVGDSPPPLAEARLAIDDAHQRLFVVGSTGGSGWSVWSLALDGEPVWTHWADEPMGSTGFEPYDDGGSSVAYDPGRNRLVLADGGTDEFTVDQEWTLALDTSTWTLVQQKPLRVGGALVLDQAGDRLVMALPEPDGVTVQPLSGGDFARTGTGAGKVEGATAVVDAKRSRILYFGGGVVENGEPREPDNAVSALLLNDLTWSVLVPATRTNRGPLEYQTSVYDPARGGVVTFGQGVTVFHGLGASDEWEPLDGAGVSPVDAMDPASVFDSKRGAIVVLDIGGGLETLPSSEGSSWQTLATAGASPPARSGAATIYEAASDRIIVHGGLENLQGGGPALDDVWTLAFGDSPVWSRLDVGEAPAPRAYEAAAYDSEGRRMLARIVDEHVVEEDRAVPEERPSEPDGQSDTGAGIQDVHGGEMLSRSEFGGHDCLLSR